MKRTRMIKITVLNDNQAGEICGAEHGLCLLIEADITLLFDTGPSDIILKNADLLGINLDQTELVVLSHGHYDHTGGLPWLKGKKLVCHPDALAPKHRRSDGSWNGVPLPVSEIRNQFTVIESREPLWLSAGVLFLGEIPRLNNFEAKSTAFITSKGTPDFMRDDSGVAITTDQGLVIIPGCAHSGVCNMVEHAIRITGINRIRAVLGGFHLKENDALTHRTIERLRELKAEEVMPCHCTMPPARRVFANFWPGPEIRSGSVVHFGYG
jgi:7,8-dihydropterin-6-yl-methyl-4-(beta-D-ribofuranosyl)aminobenzene 5'-phosphate synthase